jgi:hypothetical protein
MDTERLQDIRCQISALGTVADQLTDVLVREIERLQSEPAVKLQGGVELTTDQAKTAMQKARSIIMTVGTTGIERKCVEAHEWMKQYFPDWS